MDLNDGPKLLLEKPEVFIFKIPPDIHRQAGSHRASDWYENNDILRGKMFIYAAHSSCRVQLEDDEGTFYGSSIIGEMPGNTFAPVVDSSRYFTLEIHDWEGMQRLIGIGFSSRRDSVEVDKVITDYCTTGRSNLKRKQDELINTSLDDPVKQISRSSVTENLIPGSDNKAIKIIKDNNVTASTSDLTTRTECSRKENPKNEDELGVNDFARPPATLIVNKANNYSESRHSKELQTNDPVIAINSNDNNNCEMCQHLLTEQEFVIKQHLCMESIWKCALCPITSTLEGLSKHLSEKHKRSLLCKWECDLCQKCVNRRRKLVNHVYKDHPLGHLGNSHNEELQIQANGNKPILKENDQNKKIAIEARQAIAQDLSASDEYYKETEFGQGPGAHHALPSNPGHPPSVETDAAGRIAGNFKRKRGDDEVITNCNFSMSTKKVKTKSTEIFAPDVEAIRLFNLNNRDWEDLSKQALIGIGVLHPDVSKEAHNDVVTDYFKMLSSKTQKRTHEELKPNWNDTAKRAKISSSCVPEIIPGSESIEITDNKTFTSVVNHLPQPQYKCKLCLESFNSEDRQILHGNPIVNSFKFNQNIPADYPYATEDRKLFKCHVCEDTFRENYEIMVHWINCHWLVPSFCSKLRLWFIDPWLKLQSSSPTRDIDKSNNSKPHNSIESQTNPNIPAINCKMCCHLTSPKLAIKRHLCPESIWKCNICLKKFRLDSLTQHISSKHENKQLNRAGRREKEYKEVNKWACSLCGSQSFPKRRKLIDHVYKDHALAKVPEHFCSNNSNKTIPTHNSLALLAFEAVTELNEKDGSTFNAIKRYFSHYHNDIDVSMIRKALLTAVKTGKVVQPVANNNGKGAELTFKVAAKKPARKNNQTKSIFGTDLQEQKPGQIVIKTEPQEETGGEVVIKVEHQEDAQEELIVKYDLDRNPTKMLIKTEN